MGHDLTQAKKEVNLTEEEMYFILRFADRMGYDKAIKRLGNPLKNFRKWFVWFGGWERPELMQWDRGCKAWEFKYGPWPVSILGHSATFYGKWFQFKLFGGYLVFGNSYAARWFSQIYWERNGVKRVLADWSEWQDKRVAQGGNS